MTKSSYRCRPARFAAVLAALTLSMGVAACGQPQASAQRSTSGFCDAVATTGAYVGAAFATAPGISSTGAATKHDIAKQDAHMGSELKLAHGAALHAADSAPTPALRKSFSAFAHALDQLSAVGLSVAQNTASLRHPTAADLRAAQGPLDAVAQTSPVSNASAYFAPVARELKKACPLTKSSH